MVKQFLVLFELQDDLSVYIFDTCHWALHVHAVSWKILHQGVDVLVGAARNRAPLRTLSNCVEKMMVPHETDKCACGEVEGCFLGAGGPHGSGHRD